MKDASCGLLKALGSKISDRPISFTMRVEDLPLCMELVTGAAVSVISMDDYKALFSSKVLTPTSLVLRTYTGEVVKPCGVIKVSVDHNGCHSQLPLHVLQQTGLPLIGRDWLRNIRLDWQSLNSVKPDTTRDIQRLLHKYQDVFSESLGQITEEEASLFLKEGTTPRFMKARTVPLALRPAVEKEIKKLVEMGIWKPVDTSEYGTPIVPVVKKDCTVRLCGDYKVTLNPYSNVDNYPLPRVDEVLSALACGQFYSKIDLSRAYQQVLMSPTSRRYLTVNTHKGLFEVNRLPFGIASAPALFQRIMDNLLKGLDGVICYLDDILITGRTEADHLKNLENLLERLRLRGVRIKKDNCEFLKREVRFLGHIIGANGVSTDPRKVQAILEAPRPEYRKQ
ncbi:uncharacterized protein K02A2.6-like [Ornithodoros turicata]|uniref:uncharacterized protein K02A2.6-like n=1 Tax=Ornithodoros turicata TaxID=34597 RepID=UPI00313A0AE9